MTQDSSPASRCCGPTTLKQGLPAYLDGKKARQPAGQPAGASSPPPHLSELSGQHHARLHALRHPAALLTLQAPLHRCRVGLLRLELARQLVQGGLEEAEARGEAGYGRGQGPLRQHGTPPYLKPNQTA